MSENKDMGPFTGDEVEVDGVYANEAGREMELERGDTFPADPYLGRSFWALREYSFDNHHEGMTDPRLIRKDEE